VASATTASTASTTTTASIASTASTTGTTGSTASAAALTGDIGPMTVGTTFDCEADFLVWSELWTEQKISWCCINAGRACAGLADEAAATRKATRAGTTATMTTSSVTVQMSFELFLPENESEAPADRASTTSSTKRPAHPKGSYVSMAAASQSTATATTVTTVSATYTTQTMSTISGTTGTTTTGTTITTSSTTYISTTTSYVSTTHTMPAACDLVCSMYGSNASCIDSIRDTAETDFAGQPEACLSARGRVLRWCPACSHCPLEITGCVDGVDVPFAPAEDGLQHAPKDAPSTAAEDAPKNGDASAAPCETECEFEGKTATCAERVAYNFRTNADLLPGGQYNCSQAYHNVVDHCPVCAACYEKEVCKSVSATTGDSQEDISYDCTGEKNLRGWTEEKRAWCCEHETRGCASSTSPLPFDCDEGLEDAAYGWSPEKKDWCCRHKGLACLDCTGAQERWSIHQRRFCCRRNGRGCADGQPGGKNGSTQELEEKYGAPARAPSASGAAGSPAMPRHLLAAAVLCAGALWCIAHRARRRPRGARVSTTVEGHDDQRHSGREVVEDTASPLLA